MSGPFIRPREEGGYWVGYAKGDYSGPTAEVYTIPNNAKPTWIVVCTDDYEGFAMLNIETLPKLRQALSKLAAELRAAQTAGLSPEGESPAPEGGDAQ